MIKVKNPDSIFLEGNEHAILLLHTFTGTVRDVKQLGYHLHEQGYTVLIPSYPGHGLPIQDFVKYDIDNWWQTVEDSFLKLREQYNNISIIGVSLGGLFSLKLAEKYDVNQIIVMSVPMKKDPEGIKYRLKQFAPRMHKVISSEPFPESNYQLIDNYTGASKFVDYIKDIMNNLNKINSSTIILYGDRDDTSYHDSAQFIYNSIQSKKFIDHYANAGHLMTVSKDKEKLYTDILHFLRQDI